MNFLMLNADLKKKYISVSSCFDAEIFHAFTLSRTNYCNVLLSDPPSCATRCLKECCKNRGSLHWLPVQVRVDFKILLLSP